MTTLPASLQNVAIVILFGILCACLGAIGYFLRDIRSSINNRLTEQDKKIEKIEQDLSKLEKTLPLKYTLRDDFIRAVAGLENKMDCIFKELGEVSKALNRLIGIGGKE